MAPALQSCFERTISLKENNFNFGTTINLKSRAVRQAAKRYVQINTRHETTTTMSTLFKIIDTFPNNTASREVFEKTILADRYYKFESVGEAYVTKLLRGRSEIAIQVAILNISDKNIIVTSTYDKTIKNLIILTLILAITSALAFVSSYIFQLSINKDFKTLLLIYPIMTLVLFVASRIALYFKRNELIDVLKKSKLICT